ncbi:hypothetical protein GCM10023219_21130 [Stakelama sediminis]|uniref:TonB family protein n=1 Tax=Stakelama sediminis TaxID=463200 RepID=A0A840Z2K6_9SPHN|nr:energy transducer TonB [Stakelama sediminis]MBB5719984.1 TonB family protein [Stakelama sediminis]
MIGLWMLGLAVAAQAGSGDGAQAVQKDVPAQAKDSDSGVILSGIVGPKPAHPAKLVSGGISDDDYPAAARKAGEQGRAVVGYTVDTHGTPVDCTIVKSSGSQTLDSTTCALVTQRFRYKPARDKAGKPVVEHRVQGVTWGLEGETLMSAPDFSKQETGKQFKLDVLIDEQGRVLYCTAKTGEIGDALESQPEACQNFPAGKQVAEPATRDGKPVRYHMIVDSRTTFVPDAEKQP